MTSVEFDNALKKAGLTKKAFADMVGFNYNSVVNWNKVGIPSWVTSWMEYYLKSKAFEVIADKVNEIRGA